MVFVTSVVLWISFLIGCASSQIELNSTLAPVCSPSDRHPDSSADCRATFTKARPIRMKDVLEELPKAFEQLKTEYGYDPVHMLDYGQKTVVNDATRYSISAGYYDEYKRGSPVAQARFRLGFEVGEMVDHDYRGPQKDPEHIHIVKAPAKLITLYKNLYKALLPLLDQGFTEDDLILPSLIFTNSKKQILLVRPGIDPIPAKGEGWSPLQGKAVELKDSDFFVNIADGKSPLESTMFVHDVCHFVDYMNSPWLMPLLRKYFRMRAHEPKDFSLIPAHELSGDYLNEFLIFPDENKTTELGRLFQTQTASIVARNANDRHDELKEQLESGELYKRISEMESSYLKMFEHHGGGALDVRSLNHFPYPERWPNDGMNYVITDRMDGRIPGGSTGMDSHLSSESFWGLVEQTVIMKALLEKNSERLEVVNPHWKHVELDLTANQKVFLKHGLVETMLKLEFKVASVLSHKMSARQLLTDVTSSLTYEDFKKTSSYQYFHEVSGIGTLEHSLFVEGLYRARPRN